MENTEHNNAFLSLRHLVKVYPNGEKAVYDFNLDIEKNEFIVIVGPSGCGKSTTLRMIAGLEDISDGDIYLGDELLNYKPSNERKMAIVFQSYALYPQMTVYNNIAFPLTINKYPMPVVNPVLRANEEIERVLTTVAFNKFIGVLYNVFAEKGKYSAKEEQVATIFGISLDAAKLLCKMFTANRELPLEEAAQESETTTAQEAAAESEAAAAQVADAASQEQGARGEQAKAAPIKIKVRYSDLSLEELDTKEQEIKDAFREQLKPLVDAETAKAREAGIIYDEHFNELDENGEVKIEQRKYTPYEIKTRVYDTAEKLDLVPYLDKLPKELSGGQMQRVALGRAIIKNVPIFMMDEPLSNLDAKLRLTMRSEIVKLHNSIGATTIYVTHDQTEAMTMASRIVVMSRGFVQQIGTPEDVYNHPSNIFVAKFIGSPTMNMFNVRFDRQNKTLSNETLEIPVDAEFVKRHDAVYAQAIEHYRTLLADFDASENFDEDKKEQARKTLREHILKTLSVTGEYAEKQSHKQEKKSFIKKIKALFAKLKKNKEPEVPYRFERDVCSQKLDELVADANGDHELTIGIRPERIKLERKQEGKDYSNSVIVKPVVCELLGGEYNIHFTFCGKNMVGQLDAKEKVTTNDEIAVKFSFDDIYVFDPVTGNVI